MWTQSRIVVLLIIALQGGNRLGVWASGEQAAGPQTIGTRKSQDSLGMKPARLRDEIIIQAEGSRKPYMPLGDGRELLTDYEGQTPYAFESPQEKREPTGLASGHVEV